MRSLLITSILLYSCTTVAQNFPGAGVIGKGYDVFGEYATAKSIKRYPLFDFGKMHASANEFGHQVPRMVLLDNVSEHVINTVQGENQIEYVRNLSAGVGLAGNAFFFKSSLEANFESDLKLDVGSFYYTYMDINEKWRVGLDIRNIDTLRHYLDPQFEADLRQMPPKTFFETYGTHFITGAYLGGRIDYSAKSQYFEGATKERIEGAVKAKIMSITGSASMSSSHEQVLARANTTEHLKVVGGNSEYKNSIHNQEQYEKWAAGIKDRPVLCGFEKNGLMAIWKLAATPARQHELEAFYFDQILSTHPLPEVFLRDAVLDGEEQIMQPFRLTLSKFQIHQDCDYPLLGDDHGEFRYDIKVYANNKLIAHEKVREGYSYHVWSGQDLTINKYVDFSLPLEANSKIKVVASIWEVDDLKIEDMGTEVMVHSFPFATGDLYNKMDGIIPIWSEYFYHDYDCKCSFVYKIERNPDKSAIKLGNEGWRAYKDGNYEQALKYSKEALAIDNSLMYVHYNVALIYLIQGNPMAANKYKRTASLCAENSVNRAALKDIKQHERKFGELKGAEEIKVYLKSKVSFW